MSNYNPVEELRALDEPTPRTAPRWLGTLLFLALLGALVAVFWPVDARGQILKPGVGLPGTPDGFRRQWCDEVVPEGQIGGCSHRAPASFNCKLCSPRGWVGFGAEYTDRTTTALRRCWEADFWGTKAQWSGVSTQAEEDWMVVAYPRSSVEYRECWYPTWEGGSVETAIPITTERELANRRLLVAEAKAQGQWKAGLITVLAFDTVSGGWQQGKRHPITGRWQPGGRWPVWLRVSKEMVALSPAPPPRPIPVPPPAPAPAPLPECELRATSRWAQKCIELGRPDLAECEVWTLGNSQSRTVAKLLQQVCPEEPPPPPPPAEPTCHSAFERFCLGLGGSPDLCLALARGIGACNPECDPKCFIPGVASTGRLTMEVGP